MGKHMRLSATVISLGLWPLVYFVHAWWPGAPWSQAIGNDFVALYYNYKVYLLDMLAARQLPLWSPMEGAGYAFFSSPFTQTFYPLNLPLMAYYEWRGGYSQFDHQFFAITALGIYAVGLYLWLRNLQSNRRAVLVAVLVCVVSFKLTELLRFPNAVHSAAWMPWILWGLTLARFTAHHRTGLLVLCLSSMMLLTAGYPYFAYYLIFLLPPYIALLWLRPSTVSRAPAVPGLRFGLGISLSFVAALVLLAPYLLKLVLLIQATADRSGNDYQYSTSVPFTPIDTLGSLIYPPVASAEGWYFVSTLALVLICVWLWHSRLKMPEGGLDLPALTFVFIAACATLVTWGSDWYLFDVLWHALPGFSSLRVWGRLNIILVPVLALMLARALTHAEARLCSRELPTARTLIPFAVLAIVVLCAQVALHFSVSPNLLWTLFFADISSSAGFLARSATVFAAFAAVLLATRSRHMQRLSPRLLAGLVALGCVVELYPVGSVQWMKAPESQAFVRTRLDLPTTLANSFKSPRMRIYDTLDPPNFNVGWVQNWYYHRYVQFDRSLFVQARPRQGGFVSLSYGSALPMGTIVDHRGVQAYRELMGLETGQRVFVTTNSAHASPQAFVADARARAHNSETQITYYDGDELVVHVRNQQAGYLNFIDNWDPHWRACVFSREVPIIKPFGTFKAVGIPAGEGMVRLRFSPWPFETRSPCES